MATQIKSAGDYSYDHVRSSTIMQDMSFKDSAPNPGDRFPQFELPTTYGSRMSSTELLEQGPFLLITGSLTCPMTKSSALLLNRLHDQYGESVQIVLLNVREAHPGEHHDQPHSSNVKMEHARRLKQREGFAFPVLVDDATGTLHQQLDGKPNSAWLVDRNCTIIYRALWAGDEAGLRQALEAAAHGQRPAKAKSTRRLVPMAKGVGVMQESLREAGPRAQRDLLKAAPPMAAMAWTADHLRPLSPKWRGFAAMGTLALALTGAATVAARLVRR